MYFHLMTSSWSAGSVALSAIKNKRSRYSRQPVADRSPIGGYYVGPFAVGDSVGRAMNSRPRPVSNLWQTFRFPALVNKEGLGRHGLNVWRLMSISVAWLASTHLFKPRSHIACNRSATSLRPKFRVVPGRLQGGCKEVGDWWLQKVAGTIWSQGGFGCCKWNLSATKSIVERFLVVADRLPTGRRLVGD